MNLPANGFNIFLLSPQLRDARLASLTNEELNELENDSNNELGVLHHQLNQVETDIQNNEREKINASKNRIYLLNQNLRDLRITQNAIKRGINIYNSYLNILKKFLKNEKKGGGFSMNSERENFNNIRKIGGASDLNNIPSIKEGEKENPILEPTPVIVEETWGFPYRLTDEFIDNVEEIYDLINNDGDYERARELFLERQIGTIFREDYQRLQNDLRNGMDLDGDEETMIKDLKEMIVDIAKELEQHFGKRMRGGKLSKEDKEVFRVEYEKDLKKDINKIRRLLLEADEEIHIGDFITATTDLKQVTRIIEEYNVMAMYHNYSSPIPQDILDQYEDLMERINREETGSRNRINVSSNSSSNSSLDRLLGTGFSKEREMNNGNLRLK